MLAADVEEEGCGGGSNDDDNKRPCRMPLPVVDEDDGEEVKVPCM